MSEGERATELGIGAKGGKHLQHTRLLASGGLIDLGDRAAGAGLDRAQRHWQLARTADRDLGRVVLLKGRQAVDHDVRSKALVRRSRQARRDQPAIEIVK